MVFWPLVISMLVLTGCANGSGGDKVPDYGNTENWAYFGIGGEEREADLFLICPTVDTKDEFNMSMGDTKTKKNFLGALNMERGIYEENTRMYAPYYRQAAMKVYSLDPEEREQYLEIAYRDVSAAFAYYLENENHDRPIILAGFSQGADMCYRLLEEYFGDPETYGKLVAVYAIGWPCTEEDAAGYPQIIPASGEDDLGVVISFDCEAPDVEETFIFPKGHKAYCINPINWRMDDTEAEASGNLGACFTGLTTLSFLGMTEIDNAAKLLFTMLAVAVPVGIRFARERKAIDLILEIFLCDGMILCIYNLESWALRSDASLICLSTFTMALAGLIYYCRKTRENKGLLAVGAIAFGLHLFIGFWCSLFRLIGSDDFFFGLYPVIMLAAAITVELTAQAERLKAAGVTPCLAILRVGDRPEDLAYERGAVKR